MLKKILIGAAVIAIAAAVYFAYRIGPRNIVGMLRYDQRKEGSLKVSDRAPDVPLERVDGLGEARLARYFTGKPTVVIFGSYT